MSQSAFLDSVTTWNRDDCRLNITTALPKLIDCVHKEEDKIYDVFKLILHNFSSVCDIQQIEKLIFSKISPKLCSSFDVIFEQVLNLIHDQHAQHIQEQIISWIQKAVHVIDGLEVCIQQILSQCEKLCMQFIHSLLPTTLHVVTTSYAHCKDSSVVYGQYLGMVSEQLSVLFKKAHSLQMILVSMIDKIDLGSEPSDMDIQGMAQVVLGLHAIGQISANLDVKITVTLWKVISRLACQYKALLLDKIDYSPVLQSLVHDMLVSYEYITQMLPTGQMSTTLDEKTFTKHLKILGFQMKILIKFIEEFHSQLSTECIVDVYAFILTVHRHTPPSLEVKDVPKTFTDEIQKQFTNGTEPLVAKLMPNDIFLHTVTKKEVTEVECGLQLQKCLLLLSICDLVEGQSSDVQNQWFVVDKRGEAENQRLSLLGALFNMVKECYVELCLPDYIQHDGKEISLYEYILLKTCMLVASFPKQYFQHVELCLLENVIQPVSHCAFMAIDVWCFIARYGSAELCKDHCIFLSKLFLSEGPNISSECCHLIILLKRLLKFLASEHQDVYISTFPVSEHLVLWSIVPLHTFSGHTCKTLVESILNMCITGINKWLESQENTAKEALYLHNCLRVLVNLLTNPFIVENHLTSTHFSTLTTKSLDLLSTLKDKSIVDLRILQMCVSTLFEITASLVVNFELDNSQILKVVQFSNWINQESGSTTAQKEPFVELKVSAMVFLQNLGKKSLAPSNEQFQVLRLLPKVFTRLLSDDHPVVQHRALETFAQFAEETPHKSVVPESLGSDERVQSQVVAYLSQISNGILPDPPSVEVLSSQKTLQQEYSKMDVTQLYIPTQWPPQDDSVKPQLKRQRIQEDSKVNDDLNKAVEQLKSSVATLSHISNTHSIPQSMKLELKRCHESLAKLIT